MLDHCNQLAVAFGMQYFRAKTNDCFLFVNLIKPISMAESAECGRHKLPRVYMFFLVFDFFEHVVQQLLIKISSPCLSPRTSGRLPFRRLIAQWFITITTTKVG